MTFEQLRVFVDLAQTRSMSSSAKNLHIDKASISKSVKKLEDELSKKLFFRYPKGCYLTPAGEQIYSSALQILALKDKLTTVKKQTLEKPSLSIFFGNSYNFIVDKLLDIIATELSPNNLILQSADCVYINNIIFSNNPDIVFTAIDQDDMQHFQFAYDQYYVYAVNNEELSLLVKKDLNKMQDFISMRELQQYSLIIASNVFSEINQISYSDPLESYLADNSLYESTSVIKCNSKTLITKYLANEYTGLLCDRLSLIHYLGFDLSTYTLLTIKPEKIYSSVVLLNRLSPYFDLLNNSLVMLQNQYSEFFPYFKLINHKHL